MDRQANRFYEFGHFRIDEVERVLLHSGEPLPLSAKVFDILLLLIENRGHVVEKDRLMKEIWPDAFVEEGNLTQNISVLRKVLSEGEDSHPYIQTIPRRGYRFVGSVTELDYETDDLIIEEHSRAHAVITDQQVTRRSSELDEKGNTRESELSVSSRVAALTGSKWPNRLFTARNLVSAAILAMVVVATVVSMRLLRGRTETAQPEIRSLAVLPLENLSGDPAQDYFADGMTDELIADLAKIRALRVVSRTSVMRYKGARNKSLPEIARELNVDAIVEGSVLRSGDRVRITAQLIQAASDRHLWGESYERDLRDTIELQREVATALTEQIKIKLTPQEQERLANTHTANPEAHEAYLKGRYFWNKRTGDGLKKAVEYFELATKEDTTYAEAYAGLGDCYVLLYDYDLLTPGDAVPRAKAAARKAIELDDTLAEAHTSLAYVEFLHDWNWQGAEGEFKKALDLNPNYATAHHWYGLYLAARGQLDESLLELERAREIDPLSLIINSNLGRVRYFMRDYGQAVEQLQKTLELDSSFWGAHYKLAEAFRMKGDYEQAATEYQKSLTLSGENQLAATFGAAYAESGLKGADRTWLVELRDRSKRQHVSPFELAHQYAAVGDRIQALNSLQNAADERSAWIIFIKVDPYLDGLRSDVRFKAILRQMDLAG